MKKIIVLFIVIITALACFALEKQRWVTQPLYVYIPKYENMSGYMEQSFNEWQSASNNLVRFKFVNHPSNANIIVEFVDFVTNCNDINAVGCTKMYYQNGQYNKAYITIGTKEYAVNADDKDSQKTVMRSKEHIYGVMLHEVGHAIGLGHSDSSGSIMYPYDLDDMQYLTREDLNLLYNKYH